jgi:hypothetical protein
MEDRRADISDVSQVLDEFGWSSTLNNICIAIHIIETRGQFVEQALADFGEAWLLRNENYFKGKDFDLDSIANTPARPRKAYYVPFELEVV